MRTQTRPFSLLALGVAVALTACADLPTASNDNSMPPTTESETLALSLDEIAGDAALLGDPEAASDFHDGALALRLGAVPSEIGVTVAGEELRFRAIVTAIAMRGPDGADVMRRSIVAWRGVDRPEQVLRLAARADEAVFGPRDASADPARAIGTFADFARHVRLRATDGSLASRLETLGSVCPNGADDPRFACNLARFEMRLDGLFDTTNDPSTRVRISSEETGVSGVVIHRTDGGSGGRPTATPARPQPTGI